MEKKQLQQLWYLNREIEVLRKQIEDLQERPEIVTDSVKGSYPAFPFTQHTIKITGVGWKNRQQKLKKLQGQLCRMLDEYVDQVQELTDYIMAIPDSEIRQIISLRYLHRLSWQQVAARMGGEYTYDNVRKKHERFLQKK